MDPELGCCWGVDPELGCCWGVDPELGCCWQGESELGCCCCWGQESELLCCEVEPRRLDSAFFFLPFFMVGPPDLNVDLHGAA